jgi:serine/threonine-protein kinase
MEQLDGIDLADVLAHERRLDPARAAQITIQICRALEAAHAAGVIHRDLKPENIFLVARDGRADFVKVLDFGIARSLGQESRLTNPGIAMGTPEYMAPEQALGGLADRRSDVYSVGALLYEMVTGIPPHGEDEEVSVLKKQELPRPPREFRPEIPEELDAVILKALEPDPAKRHQRMAGFEYDLTKTQWGRPRAVSDLLGLRGPEARSEESGGTRDRLPAAAPAEVALPAPNAVPVAPAPLIATATPAPLPANARPATPSRPLDARSSGIAPVVLTPPPVPGRAFRFWAPVALLAATAVAGVAAYRQLPLAFQTVGVSAAPAVDPHPARAAALAAEVEGMLPPAAPLTFARLGALADRLARLRREGAGAAADALAARAARALEEVATRELDAGDVDTGIAHYKIALGVDPGAQGTSQLAATLRTRAEAALKAERANDAVRWARTALGLAEADPDAHALLAAALLLAHDDDGAATEFGKALASRPNDPEFMRGLDRAQHHAGRPASPRRRARASAAKEDAAAVAEKQVLEAPAPKDDDQEKVEPADKPDKSKKAAAEPPAASPAGETAPE